MTGVDAAPDGCFDAVDGIAHRSEQLGPTVAVQSVGVGDESEPGRPVGASPAEPGLVNVIVDRYAEAGELRHVVDGAARGSELEVEQRNGDAVTEDDVRRLHVVVAHERPPRRVSQSVVPAETLRVEGAGGVVQPAQQPGDGRQRGVGLAPVRIGRPGDLTVDEHEALASVLVDTDGERGTFESGVAHRPQEGVDRTRVRTRGAKNMRTDTDHQARVGDPAIELLLIHTATLTDEWRSHRRAHGQLDLCIGETHQRRGLLGVADLCRAVITDDAASDLGNRACGNHARGRGRVRTLVVGLYRDHVFARVVDVACNTKEKHRIREIVCAPLSGEVLEIGFGTGLNLPHLPATVTRLLAVDPLRRGRDLAAERLDATAVVVQFIGSDGEALPIDDRSVDAALSTWTLCSIPDPVVAVREIGRVLRPGGAFQFVEHGLAPPGKAQVWQNRLNGIQRRLFCGCNLNRDIPAIIEAGGMTVSSMNAFTAHGEPKTFGWTYQGTAHVTS